MVSCLIRNILQHVYQPELFFFSAIQSAMRINYDAYDKQTVWSSGFIITRSTVVSAIMSCDFTVTYFPYDKQECAFEISPMITHDGIYTVSKYYKVLLFLGGGGGSFGDLKFIIICFFGDIFFGKMKKKKHCSFRSLFQNTLKQELISLEKTIIDLYRTFLWYEVFIICF